MTEEELQQEVKNRVCEEIQSHEIVSVSTVELDHSKETFEIIVKMKQ